MSRLFALASAVISFALLFAFSHVLYSVFHDHDWTYPKVKLVAFGALGGWLLHAARSRATLKSPGLSVWESAAACSLIPFTK